MKKFLFLSVIISILICTSTLKADTYSTFVTTYYHSKNRKFFVKVTPDKKAVLYKNGKKVWSIKFPELPEDVLITNDGKRVIMIENYYGNNSEAKKEVVIFFDENGVKFSSFTLENLADFQNVLHTTSTAHWLGKYELDQEQSQLLIETVVLTCPLLEKVSNVEDMEKNDERIKPRPKEEIIFSVNQGTLISRAEINNNEK